MFLLLVLRRGGMIRKGQPRQAAAEMLFTALAPRAAGG